MIQDLMLPITGTGGDANALAAAIALADNCGAHLSVVQPVVLPLPAIGPLGVVADATTVELLDQLRGDAETKAVQIRARLAQAGISWEVRTTEPIFGNPLAALAHQARLADLVVLPAPRQDTGDAAIARSWFSSMLFESGRPVLAVPAHHPIELPIRHVVLAWKSTRESTRALHDALPLLAAATSIDVVTVDPVAGELDEGPASGVDVATHLARHGLQVNLVNLPREGQTVATVLLRHAAAAQAELLVAGGYGHSRLREWALGGTTRELLAAIHLPILFSH